MTFLFLLLTSLSLLGTFLFAQRSTWGIAAGVLHLFGFVVLLLSASGDGMPTRWQHWLALGSWGWAALLWIAFDNASKQLQHRRDARGLAPLLEELQRTLQQTRKYRWLPSPESLSIHGYLPLPGPKDTDRDASDASNARDARDARDPALQVDLWVRFAIENGQRHTVFGASTSQLPMGLELTPRRSQELALTTWFPASPTETLQVAQGWKPHQGLFGEVSVCLGQLSGGLWIEGIERDILPLFSAATTTKIDALSAEGALALSAGSLTLVVPGYIDDLQHLQMLQTQLIEIVEALSLDRAAQRKQIEAMITSEPAHQLRLRSLELLQQFAPNSPEAIKWSRWATQQPEAPWRLLGALHLKPQDNEALKALLADQDAPKPLRCQALDALYRDHKGEALWALYSEVLQGDDGLFWSHTLKHMEQRGNKEALALLTDAVRDMAWPPPAQLQSGILRAFGACATPDTFVASGAEQQILRMLKLPMGQQLARMLMRLLTSWGSGAALLPLHQVKRRKSWAPLLGEVELCCEHIRSRMDPAEAGQLSLASPEDEGLLSLTPESDGHVSLAPESEGHVSLVAEAEGQLSLSPSSPNNKP